MPPECQERTGWMPHAALGQPGVVGEAFFLFPINAQVGLNEFLVLKLFTGSRTELQLQCVIWGFFV